MDNVIANMDVNIRKSDTKTHSETLPEINGNETDFIRLFQNIISNAIRYRHPNRKPNIKIPVEKPKDETVFSFADNGIEIPSQNLKQIFSPYKQVSTNSKEGYGLGLFICKKIIKNYKGKIRVESELGKGSNFKFSIPVTS